MWCLMFENTLILSFSYFKAMHNVGNNIAREITSLILNTWNFQFSTCLSYPLPDLKSESHEVNEEPNKHVFCFSFEKMEFFKEQALCTIKCIISLDVKAWTVRQSILELPKGNKRYAWTKQLMNKTFSELKLISVYNLECRLKHGPSETNSKKISRIYFLVNIFKDCKM